MKLGIMQPYLFPYIGYFQLINAVDTYVNFGDVQYIRKGWVNRNNILNPGKQSGPLMFTFSVKQDDFEKKINERYYADSFATEANRLLKTLHFSYHRAKYYDEVRPLITSILDVEMRNVGEFNTNALQRVCEYIGIDTEFLVSSDLGVPDELRLEDRIFWICDHLNADTYINAIGGQSIYFKDDFAKKGIQLNFIKSGDVQYAQFKDDFVENLSIIDVMMFNSPEEIRDMLKNFTLI